MDAKPLEKPDLYLVARFLDKLWTPDGMPGVEYTKAKLQTAVGLKYELFTRYVDFLLGRGFISIERTKRGDQVRLTEAGRDAHKRLVEWLRQVFGESALKPRGRANSKDDPAPGPQRFVSGS